MKLAISLLIGLLFGTFAGLLAVSNRVEKLEKQMKPRPIIIEYVISNSTPFTAVSNINIETYSK